MALAATKMTLWDESVGFVRTCMASFRKSRSPPNGWEVTRGSRQDVLTASFHNGYFLFFPSISLQGTLPVLLLLSILSLSLSQHCGEKPDVRLNIAEKNPSKILGQERKGSAEFLLKISFRLLPLKCGTATATSTLVQSSSKQGSEFQHCPRRPSPWRRSQPPIWIRFMCFTRCLQGIHHILGRSTFR